MAGLGQSRARAARLLTLAVALRQGHGRTLAELREQVGLYQQSRASTGRAQFERDKQALLEAGVVVRVDAEHRYRVHGDVAQPFAEEELRALGHVAGAIADPDTGAALAAFAARADAYPELGTQARVLATVPDAPLLVRAIEERRCVRFGYRGASRPPDERHVEPWALRARRGLWYLLAFDRDRGAHRHFRLDRLVGPPALDGDAETGRPEQLPADLLPGGRGPVRVALGPRGRFDAERLGATLGPGPRGATVAWFPQVRDEAALGFALRHDARVLDPPELDDERRLRAALVHDLHTRPAPAVPTALGSAERDRPSLDATRLRRLLLLPAWIENRQGVTIEEAARGLGCDPDELREDVAVLGEVVLPVLGEVHDVFVDQDDCIQGHSALLTPVQLSALDRGRVRQLLEQARPLLGTRAGAVDRLVERVADVAVSALDPEADALLVRRLREAVDARCTVSFRYLARDEDEPEERTVTPTELAFVDGRTYLIGHDHGRAEGRVFRVDRLARLQVGPVDPEPRELDLGIPRYVPSGPEVEVVLRCTHVGSWVLARLVPEARVDEDDGTVWARVRSDVERLVVDHVLVGAGEVEVVAPAALRRSVAERADAVR